MVYLFCIGVGLGLAIFLHCELAHFKAWGAAELAKLSNTLKKN
jgi:hypothetical protein